MTTRDKTARIRELNDDFRKAFVGGRYEVSAAVRARGPDFIDDLFKIVRTFDAFTKYNDSYGKHDSGLLEIDGEKFFWKIDYYDAA